jgi:hypothetical protein
MTTGLLERGEEPEPATTCSLPAPSARCAAPPAAVRPGWPVCWTKAMRQALGVTSRRDAVAAVAAFEIDATGATP